MRQARALLGWFSDQQAHYYLSGQQANVALTAQQQEAVRSTRFAVSQMPVRVEAARVIQNLPRELTAHIEAFQQSINAQPFLTTGWKIAFVDLRQIYSIQPVVYTDHGESEAIANLTQSDLMAIANISLPITAQPTFKPQYDPINKVWIISSPSSNLQVGGHWSGFAQVAPGQTALVFGYHIGILSSFIQVARFHGRLVLRDGYHRACVFIRHNIFNIPVLFREYGPLEAIGIPPEMLLPGDVILGDRPPLLTDYHNDAVSVEISLPVSQKMVVISCLQFGEVR